MEEIGSCLIDQLASLKEMCENNFVLADAVEEIEPCAQLEPEREVPLCAVVQDNVIHQCERYQGQRKCFHSIAACVRTNRVRVCQLRMCPWAIRDKQQVRFAVKERKDARFPMYSVLPFPRMPKKRSHFIGAPC